MVFRLPSEMQYEEIKGLFEKFGNVLEVDMSTYSVEDNDGDWLRQFVRVTFESKKEAMVAARKLNNRVIRFKIGRESYPYRIRVKPCKKQTYKKDLQSHLDEKHEAHLRMWDATPEDRYIQRMAMRDMDEYQRDFFSGENEWQLW